MEFLIAALIGFASGMASGLFGVGGGMVMVPAMVYFLKLDVKVAIGTSLAVIIPTAISGVLKHHQLGHVDLRTVLTLVPAAVCGSYLGAWLTRDISSGNLKRAFGGFLVLAGCRLLLGR
jgi:uncharacterized membrane protein YfcA